MAWRPDTQQLVTAALAWARACVGSDSRNTGNQEGEVREVKTGQENAVCECVVRVGCRQGSLGQDWCLSSQKSPSKSDTGRWSLLPGEHNTLLASHAKTRLGTE